jgi:hypothetical protein
VGTPSSWAVTNNLVDPRLVFALFSQSSCDDVRVPIQQKTSGTTPPTWSSTEIERHVPVPTDTSLVSVGFFRGFILHQFTLWHSVQPLTLWG